MLLEAAGTGSRQQAERRLFAKGDAGRIGRGTGGEVDAGR
jgi:hypothetical protein